MWFGTILLQVFKRLHCHEQPHRRFHERTSEASAQQVPQQFLYGNEPSSDPFSLIIPDIPPHASGFDQTPMHAVACGATRRPLWVRTLLRSAP